MDLQTTISQRTEGVGLIVSISYSTDRLPTLDATHEDAKQMKRLLSKYNYAVFHYHDITREQFIILYEQLACYKYPKTCRRLIVYFSGHGDAGILGFPNEEFVLIDEMVKRFKPADAENSTLGNMVRMFFIDACRGKIEDYGYSYKGATATKQILNEEYPNDANMLVAYSSTPNHSSIAYPTGSRWTSCLIEKLEKSDDDLHGILVEVNKEMTIKKDGTYQTGQIVHTLTEKVYFRDHPEAKEFLKTMTKGGGRGGAAQLISSAATGTAKQCAKEIGKRATGEGVKKAAAQLTIAGAKVVAKQAALQAVKPKVVVIGMVIEGGMLIHEIRTAHNRRRRGEITKEQFHDTVVEQTATTGGSTAGGIGGSLVGASVGAVVGSVVPVVGTVIGGTIGTVVGGFAGGLGGSLAGKGVGKLINAVRRS